MPDVEAPRRIGAGGEREPGGNPGLSRSGEWERTPPWSTGRTPGKRRAVGGGRVPRARESEDLPAATGTPCPSGHRLGEWACRPVRVTVQDDLHGSGTGADP
ncbi:hypothetical protein GCM10023353_12910 [Tomitella cavernea]|uniref:Uncharacterized protein n=1 Tax=Tomitella cavernea TaxID=1387982 RepID=A0ABP9CLT2_9ACTN